MPSVASEVRIEVLEGGEPSPEEFAAIVLALTPDEAEGPGRGHEGARPSGWRRAALLEGVRRTRYASASDLHGEP